MTPRTIYEKVCNGDNITDDELDVGIRHFRDLTQLLIVSGPVFKLATNEAARVYQSLEGFKKARTSK